MPSGKFVLLVLAVVFAAYWWSNNVPTTVGSGDPICLPTQTPATERPR